MIRKGFLTRIALLTIAVAFIAMVVMFGRWLGLSEILIVGLIIVSLLTLEAVRVIVAGILRGYRGG